MISREHQIAWLILCGVLALIIGGSSTGNWPAWITLGVCITGLQLLRRPRARRFSCAA